MQFGELADTSEQTAASRRQQADTEAQLAATVADSHLCAAVLHCFLCSRRASFSAGFATRCVFAKCQVHSRPFGVQTWRCKLQFQALLSSRATLLLNPLCSEASQEPD